MKRFLLVILLSVVSLTHAQEKSPRLSELQTHKIPVFNVSQRFNAFYIENENKNIATTVTTLDMQFFRYSSRGFGGVRGYFQAPLMQGIDTYAGIGGFGGGYVFDNRKYINNNVMGSTMAIISEGYWLWGEDGRIGAGGFEFRYTHNFSQFFAINVGANFSIGSITENNSASLFVTYGGFVGFSF